MLPGLLLARNVLADGFLVPGSIATMRPDAPNFAVKYHHVSVKIKDQVAITRVDQVFVNETNREQEATYVFPLPPGAVVRSFTLYAGGEKVAGEMLSREDARGVYESIVRKRKDPALLEYIGRDMYQARIFPIPPQGQRRVELQYTEVLKYDSGLVTYLYPLSTEKFSAKPIDETTVDVLISAAAPIGAVYSPSHDVAVTRKGRHDVVASWREEKTKPEQDVLLYYTVSEADIGANVLTFKEPEHDGFFLLMAAPTRLLAGDDAVPKDVTFVLDTSGSMRSDNKIEQAKEALLFCLSSLNEHDRFDIITFSSTVVPYGDGLATASTEAKKKATAFIKDITATGGTDIDSALATAIDRRDGGSTNYILFLTDGQPTVGVRDEDAILENVKNASTRAAARGSSLRAFVFGVGYDVNTHFLDKLATRNGGTTTYVRPSEDIEVKVSSFFSKIADPMLTALSLDYGGVRAYDCFPQELPDLFAGSQLLVLGRYKAASAERAELVLSGSYRDDVRRFSIPTTFPQVREEDDYIAGLWAARKLGFLLDEIRLHGESKELVDEIMELSTQYGILTEYTAFLAREGGSLTGEAARATAHSNMAHAFSNVNGGWAVSQAVNAQRMQVQAQAPMNAYVDANGQMRQIVNTRRAGQRAFYQEGKVWADSRYQRERHQEVVQVQNFSDAYFQLSRRFPELNRYMAVGSNATITFQGRAIEIGDTGKMRFTEHELEELARPVS
jgi:Ca-activated chloride channel family protein